MIPHGHPRVVVLRLPAEARLLGRLQRLPSAASSSVAVATSNAALLDSPPPSGTSEITSASSAGGTRPRAPKPATTPRA